MLIPGASRGLGRLLAISLVGAGASVGLIARSGAELAALVGAIRRDGGTAAAAAADITDPQATAIAVKQLCEQLGVATVLINNGCGRLMTHGKLQGASIGGLVSGLPPQKRIRSDDEHKDGCPVCCSLDAMSRRTRPSTTPAYYQGRSASVWLAAFRSGSLRTKAKACTPKCEINVRRGRSRKFAQREFSG